MREFKTRFNDIVDLDDPKTYSYLPDELTKLRNLMFKEIGYFYCYTEFWHKDLFDGDEFGQVKRATEMIREFTLNEMDHYSDEEGDYDKNVLWYKERVFLFQEEIENMC